ncbi:MAG TPA: AMP-binding protein [Bacteroidales bacterium]|nr:AMP-binding protein [Bacteroidales bacterium]
MTDTEILTFPSFFENTLQQYPNHGFLTVVGEKPVTYAMADRKIGALIRFLEESGVKPGDKIAILSINQPHWAIAFFATTFMGAVAVPLLPDFLPAEIELLINHSESKVIFASGNLIPKLRNLVTPNLQRIVKIEDFSVVNGAPDIPCFQSDSLPLRKYSVEEDQLASIIYTSGTTGKPKGVMLSHRNICFTAVNGHKIQPIHPTDRFLSILPLSHTYENTLGLILPMYRGACIYYLLKPPIPQVLLPALATVRPTTMLTVPLIIEKIFRSKILPGLTGSPVIRFFYRIPRTRKLLHLIAGKKLMTTFGGELTFFGVGGAKLDKTVERFLIESRFPYAVGYGLTECAPLLAGFNPQNARLQSTGPACEGVELKINDPDPTTGEGEIWAAGPNIMLGYYKEPELTREIITPDGWFRTGDLGIFDQHKNLYIKGRSKSVIIRPNGENIYPEDIESVINNFKHVIESLVIEQKGKLVALVHFNQEEIALRYQSLKNEVASYVEQRIEELRLELQEYVNARVKKYQQVQVVISQPAPFQKTATQKIKRFLYT